MSGMVKMLGGQLHPFEIAFFRCLFGLAAILPFLIGPGGSGIKTDRPWLYALRCAIGVTAILANFYSLTNLPLATAVAVSFTKPLFMLVLAGMFLGEMVGWQRGVATAVGFFGVIVLLHPDTIGSMDHRFVLGTSAAVYAAFAMAVVLVLVKKLSVTEQPATLLFWFTLASAVGTLAPALTVWQMPSLTQTAWLVAVGLSASAGQYCIFRAYQIGEATVVGPVDYTQLLWAGMIGNIFFAEDPDLSTLVGAVLIVASTFYVLRHGSRMKNAAAEALLTEG
jgi:drug/metabolite transporter (DMT)-like permease